MATGVSTYGRGLTGRLLRRSTPSRRPTFDAPSVAWQHDVAELTRMAAKARVLTSARTFRPRPAKETPPWLELRTRETVLRKGTSARLVEVGDWPGLQHRGYGEFMPSRVAASLVREMPSQARVVDLGQVVITDQRVAFGGTCYRQEWDFSRMVGMAHDEESPCTVMRTTDRTKAGGLVLGADVTPGFRFDLTLALADAVGDRWGFAAHLEGLLATQQRHLPEPHQAEPDPSPARRGSGGGSAFRALLAWPRRWFGRASGRRDRSAESGRSGPRHRWSASG